MSIMNDEKNTVYEDDTVRRLTEDEIHSLIKAALEARQNAYAPYSGFLVGAALLADSGRIYTGVNVENASYPVGICAERSAFAAAVSAGERSFSGLAIVGGGSDGLCITPPCGMCRQTIAEFCKDSFELILARSDEDHRILTLGGLFPERFSL